MQNTNLDLAQQKLSISPEQVKKVRRLANKKVSGHEIARRLGVAQSKIWRNMELMGLNNKKGFRSSGNNGYFDCNEFSHHYKY